MQKKKYTYQHQNEMWSEKIHHSRWVVRWYWANFQYRGVLLIWIRVGQGPSVLAVGAGGVCLDIFSLVYHFSFFLPISGRRPDIDYNTVSKGR